MTRAAPLFVTAWVLLTLAGGALEAARLWAMRYAVNALVGVDAEGRTLAQWLIGLAAIFAVQQVVQILEPYVSERVRVAAGFDLQDAALGKLGRLPLDVFDTSSNHDVIRRVSEGADKRGMELVGHLLAVVQLLPTVGVSVVALALTAPWLPVLAVGGQALLLWTSARQGALARRFEVAQTRQRRLADYYASLLTQRAAAPEVRLWGLRDILLGRWRAELSAYFQGRLRLALSSAVRAAGSSAGFVLLLPGALVLLALFNKSIEPGLAALVLTALRNVTAGMYMMMRSVRSFVTHAGYASDLRFLLESMPTEEAGAAPTQAFPEPLREGIHLQGVGYRYPGAERDSLTDVNVTIRAGEVVALVGSNGAGKTTLAGILTGLRRPTTGTVLADGVDLRQVSPSAIRNACAVVPQNPMRYPASLQENIALAAPASEPARLRQVLEGAGLSGQAPALDALLGPEFGGTDLSGGQWQRVAIARALFRPDARVIVFDEPTSAIDPQAELELFKRIADLGVGRTTILISHRLGPARLADRVVVLEGGRVVEQGPPAELLAAGGRFAEMYAAQAGWYT
ncbi:ABC transporter ATP-binding protein [Corallococcus exercitus]|uniref:ABC transporter ATP-binding protein n=1 Tax=Corallococcus exercitus TaxID=2316736 RepID=UPI0035D3F8A4